MATGFPDVEFVKIGAVLAGDYQQVGLVCTVFPKKLAEVIYLVQVQIKFSSLEFDYLEGVDKGDVFNLLPSELRWV